MKKDVNGVFDEFLNTDDTNEKMVDKITIKSVSGELVERVNKVFITESGKQLLND